jgi:HlyD family secretion protein
LYGVRRAWLWVFVVLALAGAAGVYLHFSGGGTAADTPYRLARVDRGSITATVRATGTLNPVTTVLVGSQLSGQVVEILADYNTPVKAGQVVARLFSDQIRSRRDAARADLEQARADLAMRRAQVERSKATLQKAEAARLDQHAQQDRARAQLAEAQRTLDRQSELAARQVGAQTALDQARTQAEVLKAALASAEAQIASNAAEIAGLIADIALSDAQVKAAEAAILQREAKLRDIEIDLTRTEIRSPVDGVVVKREVELGQTVAASLSAPTLFTVAQDLREIDIHASIDEADVGRLQQNQPVTFTVSAYPNRTFAGAVRMVRLGAQTVQNVVTYTAVVAVDNSDLALLPGMTANLQIIVEERRDVLRVPNAALRFRPAFGAAGDPIPSAPPNVVASLQERPRIQPLGERIAQAVGPNPDQMAQIEKILAESRGAAPAVEPGLPQAERRATMRRLRQELQGRIEAVLDDGQRIRFAALLAQGRNPAGASTIDIGIPGRIYVLDSEGQPKPIALRLGITDGATTEIVAGDIAEGTGVIVGGGPRGAGAGAPPDPNTPTPGQRPRGPRPF